jgi:hypothetical protein
MYRRYTLIGIKKKKKKKKYFWVAWIKGVKNLGN